VARSQVPLLCSASAPPTSTSAQAITVDGNWNDWFTSSLTAPTAAWWYNGGTANAPASELNGSDAALPTSLIANAGYALDYEHHGTNVYGGAESNQDGVGAVINTQAYDIEAVMSFAQTDILGNTTLYLGIVSGMTQAGQNVNGMLYGGDVFVDFGLTPSAYDRAVRINTAPGSNYGGGVGTLFTAPPSITGSDPVDFPQSRPYRVTRGSVDANTAAVAWSNPTVHNFVEMSFGITSAELTALRTTGMDVHWTITCGNDVFNPHFQLNPRPPVPEPSTMILLGIGMIGLALRKKFSA